MIFVTNKNGFTHQDRYDGTDYVFPPNQSIPVDEGAAAHMFGYGQPDKGAVLHRLGWSFQYDEAAKHFKNDDTGVVKLAKFIFSKGEYVPVSPRQPSSTTGYVIGTEQIPMPGEDEDEPALNLDESPI